MTDGEGTAERFRGTDQRYRWKRPAVALRWPQIAVALAFAAFVFLSIAFPIWGVAGVPVRALLGITMLALLCAASPLAAYTSLKQHGNTIAIIAAFAFLGLVVSALNGMSASQLLRQLSEIHVQAVTNLILTAVVLKVCGVRLTTFAILAPIAISSAFAVLQAAGVEGAWQLRYQLGTLQKEIFLQYGYFNDRRAMGLSLSPIILATQLCLGLALIISVRQANLEKHTSGRPFDLGAIVSAVIFISICFASGNRSPILGALAFVAIYVVARRPTMSAMLLPIGAIAAAVVAPSIIDTLSTSGSRVASVDDASSLTRMTLAYYGLLLFWHQPLGYGLGFHPAAHWPDFWSQLSTWPQAQAIQIYPLHNYPITMLNFYGICIAFLLPPVFALINPYRRYFLAFIPYAVHILFHNSGPLWNDYAIWLIVAVIVELRREASPTGGDAMLPSK